MATVEELAQRQEAATIKVESAAHILDRVGHGSKTETVQTANGPAPSVLKFMEDRKAEIAAATGAVGRFCGAVASGPATRLDGSALQQGDEYHNTGDKLRYSWSGTAWVSLNSSAQELEAKLATPAQGASIVAAPGAGTVAQALGAVSVAQTGGTGLGNETTKFVNACTLAVAQGHKRVFIPFPAFTVTANTDCQDCEIIAAGTVLTGSLQNFRSMTGVSINGRNTDDRRIHPVARSDLANKLIKYIDATYIQVIVPKKSKGYALIELKSNVTTAFDSLASGSSDVCTHRVVAVTNCVDAIVGYKTANASTGTWTTPFLISGIAEAINGGIQYSYLQGQAGTAGIYYEMSIVVPSDGWFNVGFLRSSSGCADVSVLVDGVAIDANFTLVEATATVELRQYKTKPGTRLIRVVKNASGGLLNLLGCNFSKLNTARNDVSISHSGYYRNSASYKDYINSTSANGYAVRDKTAGVWGGEYHGGEKSIVERLLIDGNLSTLTAGQIAVCKSLAIRATFNIDYTAHVPAGSLLACRKEHEFCIGGYNHTFGFVGLIRAESLFTTLVGVNPDLNLILYPVLTDLDAMADSTRQYFGRQNRVVYGCKTTDQQLSITHTSFTNEDSEKGGAYIFKNLSPGDYDKYYYAPVDRGDKTFGDLSALTIIEVC